MGYATEKPDWKKSSDEVILKGGTSYAPPINIICIANSGQIEFQIQDNNEAWFTPSDPSFTVNVSAIKEFHNANMPDVKIKATNDATFYVLGYKSV